MTLTFTRPPEPAIPSFVAPPEWKHNAAFAIGQPRRACPANDEVSAVHPLSLERRRREATAAPARRACRAPLPRGLGDRLARPAELRARADHRRPAEPLTSAGRLVYLRGSFRGGEKWQQSCSGRTADHRPGRPVSARHPAERTPARRPSLRRDQCRRGVDVASGRRSHAILQAQQPAHGHGRRHDLVRRLAHRRHRPGRLAELRLGLVVPAARADRPPVRPDRGARRGRRLSHRPHRARVVLRREGAEDARGRAVQRRAARARRQRRGRDERRGVLQAPLPRRQPTARQRTGRQRRGALVDGDRAGASTSPATDLPSCSGATPGPTSAAGWAFCNAARDAITADKGRSGGRTTPARRRGRHATASPATTPASPRRSQSASARTAG